MTLYKDNPELKQKIITTVRGDKEYRINCQRIKDKYYLRDRDCFKFNDKWYRYDSGFIVFDHEKKQWLLKQSEEAINLKHGVVSVTSDGQYELGYFTENQYNNCFIDIPDKGRVLCINVQILEENGYKERLQDCVWYCGKRLNKGNLEDFNRIRSRSYTHKGYSIEDNHMEYDKKRYFYDKYKLHLNKDVINYARLLGDITYGIEMETSAGHLPEWLENRHGIVMCRDGSIGGGEAVTVPMSGAKGLQNIKEICTHLKKRCNVDLNCSLHIHIGNIPTDRTFMSALYILCYKIQDDVFKMFPYYKTDPSGVKNKNYCQKLKKMSIHPIKDLTKEGYETYINDVYGKLFYFLSDGLHASQEFNRSFTRHPITRKYERPSRYYYVNLQNMIFSERGTCEFRFKCRPL